jgi:uncharacterized Zn finger protein
MARCDDCWQSDFRVLECDGVEDKLGCLDCGYIWTSACPLDEDNPSHGNQATQEEEKKIRLTRGERV